MNSFANSTSDPIVAQNLVRYFGDVKAVDGINITVKTGNMCNVRHTHTLPMNAPPPHTPHTGPRAPPRSTHTDTHMRQEEKIENIPALIRAIIQCKDKSSYVQIALCDFADNSSMHVWRKLFASGIPTCFKSVF